MDPFFHEFFWFWQGFNAVRMLKMRQCKKKCFSSFFVDKDYFKMKNGGNLNILFLCLRKFVKQQCIGCLSTNLLLKVPYMVSYSISLRFACCVPSSRKKNINYGKKSVNPQQHLSKHLGPFRL